MQRSEIIQTFYFRCPGAGLRASIEMKGDYPSMKKIFKNLAKHFAKYGQHATEYMGL